MAEPSGFFVYKDIEEQINLLTDEELGKLFRALLRYTIDGEIIEMPNSTKIVFFGMKSKIDRDYIKYEETKKRRAEAGKKHKGNQYTNLVQNGTNGTNGTSVPTMEQMERTITKTITETIPITKTIPITETITETKTKAKTKAKTECTECFAIPSIEEIQSYIVDKGYSVNAEAFHSFYQSKNWMVGKNKMKDWKACIRTWEIRNSKSDVQESTERVYKEIEDGEVPF